MIKKYFWVWLGVIVLVGGLLRMIGLDKNPPHIGNDEISIAFDSSRPISTEDNPSSFTCDRMISLLRGDFFRKESSLLVVSLIIKRLKKYNYSK